MGINVHSEDLLRDPSLIADVKHAGLALFCWGEDNDKADNVQYLRSQGVDGIISNRSSTQNNSGRQPSNDVSEMMRLK